jgi:thiol-disulfide isomerase/thioredoxin
MRPVRSVAILLIFLFAVGAASAASKAALSAKDLEGRKVRLKDVQGNLIVLNFWATWCGPCREELPMLIRIAKEDAVPDLLFIAVSVDDSKALDKVGDAVRKFGITFPVWVGASADDVHRLSAADAVPATVFIDRDGTVLARVSGEIRESELKERLKWLTGHRSGAPPQQFISHVE